MEELTGQAIIVILIALVGCLGVILPWAWPWLGRAVDRPAICPRCGHSLNLLSEEIDTSPAWLTGERIYFCPNCGGIQREPFVSVFGEGMLP